jgi:hypothetical protein
MTDSERDYPDHGQKKGHLTAVHLNDHELFLVHHAQPPFHPVSIENVHLISGNSAKTSPGKN